jgi:hypothetical protein
MATQAQIDANRANSKQSTGPTTSAGKANSSRNRLSHGFASSTRFIKGEDPEEFYALLNDLINEHQPATPTQQILVEKMAHHQWISLRASRIQGDVLGRMMFPSDIRINLPVLIRYQTAADRAFHKAHAELLKAQKESKKPEIGFESKNANKPAGRPAESHQKTPVVVEKPAPQAPIEPDAPSLEEELEWVMAAGLEEMRATTL